YQMKSELFTEFIERMLKGELTLKEVTDVAVNSLQANSLLVKNLAKNFKTETFKKTLESIKAEKYNPDTEKALISMLLNYASDELVAPDSEVSLSRKKEIIKEVLESGKAEDILKAVYKKNKWFVSGPAQMFFAVDKGYMNLIRFICFAITENGAVKGNLDSSLLARFFYYLYMDKCERFNIIPNEQEFLGFVDRTFHIIKDTPGYSSISINITFEIANIQKYAQAQYRLNQQKTAMGKIAIDDAFRFRFTRIKTYQKYGKLNDLPENWYRRDLTQNYNEEGEYIYSKELRDCEINFAPKRERWATVFSPWFYASHFPLGLVPQGAERAEDLRWQGLQNIRHWALIPFKLGVGVAIISAVLGLGIGLIIAQIAFILAGLITATISISVGTVKALDVGQIFHRLSNAINSFLPMSEKQIITSRRANLRRDLAASKITRDDLKADVLIVCGNEDVDRYEDLLRLYAEEKVKYLILSGGIGRATPQLLFNAIKKGYKFDNLEVRDGKIFLKRDDGTVSEITKSGQGVSEAEIIYEIMNHMRTKLNIEISDERFESIRLEKSSRTTIENFKYSIENNKDLFEENAVVAYSAKPDQQLRTLITFNSVMDSIKRKGLVGVSYSDENAMKNFANDIQDEIMVREMQRLIVFLAINIIDSKGVVDKKYFKECLNSFVAFMEANPNKEKLNDIIINGISNAYVTEDKTKREKQWELFPTAEVFLSKIPKDLRTPQFDQYIEGLYIRAGRGEEVKAPVKKITTGFPAVRNILTLGIDRQNFDMRSIFTGSRIILWIKRQIAKRLPVYRYAPELLGKHYVVLSSNFNESVDKVRNIAEEGMNCISIAPLPESYTGSAVNLSKPIKEGGRNLGKVNVEGINIEISAEKIQTKKGSFWQLYYNLEKGAVIVEEMKRLFNARSLTSIAEWLKGNSAALEFMGKSIDTFNLDIIEMDDYLSVPELIKDRINKIVFKNSVLVHFGNRDESEISLPAREKIAKEFKGLGKDILFKKAFDVEIEESAKIADSLKTIEAVSKIKKEELLAKTEPSVYENLSTVGKSEEEIIEHIKNHNEMGIDTFIIIGADFKQAANLTKKFEAEIKNKQMHFIINYEINIASDITAQEKDILKLLKLGAYGVRLNMSEIKDSKKIGEIGNLMMKLKAKILKINPEAVLLVLPSELPEFEAIFKISDVKKVVRYLPGKMPARVPENCWLEMNIKGFNFEENMDVSIKDEIEKLIKAEVNVVGFDSEMTDNLELNGPVGFDIGGYLLRLINSRRDEFLRNPEERFKQAHFTALKQNEKDIPDIASIWEEMIALDKEYMASADNAVKDNSFVNKIYEKIKNLPNYEKYGVLSAYVERYHKLTVDELDPERKKLYLAALMGFVRGLMEANALRNYLGDITRITDEAERNRFAWGLVEFQIQTGIQLMINKDMKANERKAVFEGWIEKLINDPSLILDEDTAELLKSKENLSSNEFMNSLINLAAKADKNSLPIIIAETLMIIDLSIDTKAKDRVKALREGARPVLPEALKGLISAA
ncbi:MAG: hypothetical protein NT145_07360, partial [Elusimicrobia bacterium]|nr:hypothetical protein [Elusimicrobiota bacterium]